jgi:hypothetical protein
MTTPIEAAIAEAAEVTQQLKTGLQSLKKLTAAARRAGEGVNANTTDEETVEVQLAGTSSTFSLPISSVFAATEPAAAALAVNEVNAELGKKAHRLRELADRVVSIYEQAAAAAASTTPTEPAE